MDDETLNMTMLFDYFGDLLTDKQREYFDLYHNEDLSLSEIAEKAGISRQGVYDIIIRAEKTLMETEKKTGIIARWHKAHKDLSQAVELAVKLERMTDGKCRDTAGELISILSSFPL